jgi:hypothetical protein
MLDCFEESTGYSKLKEKALNHHLRGETGLRRGFGTLERQTMS